MNTVLFTLIGIILGAIFGLMLALLHEDGE